MSLHTHSTHISCTNDTHCTMFIGQRGPPLLFSLPESSYRHQNFADIAHNLHRVMLMFVNIIVGRGAQGIYQKWTDQKDRVHRAVCELAQVFPDIWLDENQGPLPWRLTATQLSLVDSRVRNVVYPHNCVTVGNASVSFWQDTHCVKKMAQRVFAFLVIMPTSLRGCVPALHRAILFIVWGLRILDGNQYSANRCVQLGIEMGSHCLAKSAVVEAHQLLITGLSMLEGCLPVGQIAFSLHSPMYPMPYSLNLTLYLCTL